MGRIRLVHGVVVSPLMGALVILSFGGCSHREESPQPDTSAQSAADRTADKGGDKPGDKAIDKGGDKGSREFIAVLVVEPHGPDLIVTSSSKVTSRSLGKAATARGHGSYVVGWALRTKAGDLVTSGEIATEGDVGLPPDPKTGAPGAHVARTPKAFTVRVPWPEGGERIELASADGVAKGVWP